MTRSARQSGLLYSTELGFNITEEQRRHLISLTQTREDFDRVIGGIKAMRTAIESGATIEEAAAIGLAVQRKADKALEQARYDQMLAAQNAQTAAINAGNQPSPGTSGLPASDTNPNITTSLPGTGGLGTIPANQGGGGTTQTGVFANQAELTQFNDMSQAEKDKWGSWSAQNPGRTFAQWVTLNKPSGTQAYAPPPSVTNPQISTSLPPTPSMPAPVAYIPPAAGGEQVPQGSTGVFANMTEYRAYQAQPQYIKDRWQRYSSRYPNRTWAGFVQRGYPTLG